MGHAAGTLGLAPAAAEEGLAAAEGLAAVAAAREEMIFSETERMICEVKMKWNKGL